MRGILQALREAGAKEDTKSVEGGARERRHSAVSESRGRADSQLSGSLRADSASPSNRSPRQSMSQGHGAEGRTSVASLSEAGDKTNAEGIEGADGPYCERKPVVVDKGHQQLTGDELQAVLERKEKEAKAVEFAVERGLSHDVIISLQNMFEGLDKNKDGVVDLEEFSEGLEGRGLARNFAKNINSLYDLDKDRSGTLTFDELLVHAVRANEHMLGHLFDLDAEPIDYTKDYRSQPDTSSACMANYLGNQSLYVDNDPDLALDYFQKATKLYPGSMIFYKNLVRCKEICLAKAGRMRKLVRTLDLKTLHKVFNKRMPRRLTPQDVREALAKSKLCKSASHEETRHMMMAFTPNQSGFVDKFELACGLAFLAVGSRAEKVTLCYKMFDTEDHSLSDLRYFMKTLTKMAARATFCYKMSMKKNEELFFEPSESDVDRNMEQVTSIISASDMDVVTNRAYMDADLIGDGAIIFSEFRDGCLKDSKFSRFFDTLDEEFQEHAEYYLMELYRKKLPTMSAAKQIKKLLAKSKKAAPKAEDSGALQESSDPRKSKDKVVFSTNVTQVNPPEKKQSPSAGTDSVPKSILSPRVPQFDQPLRADGVNNRGARLRLKYNHIVKDEMRKAVGEAASPRSQHQISHEEERSARLRHFTPLDKDWMNWQLEYEGKSEIKTQPSWVALPPGQDEALDNLRLIKKKQKNLHRKPRKQLNEELKELKEGLDDQMKRKYTRVKKTMTSLRKEPSRGNWVIGTHAPNFDDEILVSLETEIVRREELLRKRKVVKAFRAAGPHQKGRVKGLRPYTAPFKELANLYPGYRDEDYIDKIN